MKKTAARVLLGLTALLFSYQINAAFESCIATSVCDARVRDASQTAFTDGQNSGFAAGVGTCQTDPSACGITLASLLPPAEYGETELNDNMIGADPLVLGARFWGQSYSAADEDWFFLVTDRQNKIMTIVFNVPDRDPATSSAADWIVSVRDAAGNVYARFSTDFLAGNPLGDDAIGYPVMLGLAGTYYVVVEPAPDALSYYPYNIMVNLQESSLDSPNFVVGAYDAEREPNDLWANANRLTSGVTMYGFINVQFENFVPGEDSFTWAQGDEDRFIYDSPGDEVITLSFCEREPCATGNWYAEVYDPQYQRIYGFNTDFNIETAQPSVFRFGLGAAGRYFFRINHKRKLEAPCTAFAQDVNNNGVVEPSEESKVCACGSGYSCPISIPNPNPSGLCPDGSGEITTDENTGASSGPQQCAVTCRCVDVGLLVEIPADAATSRYNFSWYGSRMSPDTGSTDAYDAFEQRPTFYQ
jgi:hypothetical protein